MGAEGAALPERVAQLRSQVKGHKKAIKLHRQELQRDAAKLEELERACRERGIKLIHLRGDERWRERH